MIVWQIGHEISIKLSSRKEKSKFYILKDNKLAEFILQL